MVQAGCGGQISLILWKNWLCQKRRKKEMIVELLFPVAFICLILIFRVASFSNVNEELTVQDSFRVDSLPSDLRPPSFYVTTSPSSRWIVGYAPDSPGIKAVMTRLKERLPLQLKGFANESEFENYMKEGSKETLDVLGGVIFDTDLIDTMLEKPFDIKYKIRLTRRSETKWLTSQTFHIIRGKGAPVYHQSKYIDGGFLALQRAVDLSIMEVLNGSAIWRDIDVKLTPLPHPPFVDDHYVVLIKFAMPFVLILCFIIPSPNLIRDVVLEKEKMIKAFLKSMGLGEGLHWSAWFVKYFIIFLLLVVIIAVILVVPLPYNQPAIGNSDVTVIVAFLLLYIIANIAFCFALSNVFSKASQASMLGGLIFFITYLPYIFITRPTVYPSYSHNEKVSLCLLHNMALGFATMVFSDAEASGDGLHWWNINQSFNGDDISMGIMMIMLMFDTVLYLLLAAYLSAVRPGKYGIPKPWYFPCVPRYWGVGTGIKSQPTESDEESGAGSSIYFQPCPADRKAGIKLRNIRKEYNRRGEKSVAIAGTYLDFNEGEITALLGPNGAGKTTTIEMISGLITPTSGTAIVDGHDISRGSEAIKTSLGICPQEDALFDLVTVKEHLLFYAKLKGFTGAEADQNAVKLLEELDLKDKKDKLAGNLSGGWKRRLSIAIAFAGNPKVVMLDEPSCGLDPEGCRTMWAFVKSQREGRTILLTTHSMEEAEALGDRIAILAKGIIQCHGTTLFLKSKYDVGYRLSIDKTPECVGENIGEVISRHIAEATVQSDIGTSVTYSLPQHLTSKFEQMFHELDARRLDLGIASYGVSVTTLEEVFLRVTSSYGAIQAGSGDALTDTDTGDDQPLLTEGTNADNNTGVELWKQHFQAMLSKRFLYSIRSPTLTISQLMTAVFLVAFACLAVSWSHSWSMDEPPLELGTQLVKDIETPRAIVTEITSPLDTVEQKDEMYTAIEMLESDLSARNIKSDVIRMDATMNFTKYLAQEEMADKLAYTNELMLAVNVQTGPLAADQHIEGFFSGVALHTSAVVLNVIGNALLKSSTNEAWSITTVNHPLPVSESHQTRREYTDSQYGVDSRAISLYTFMGLSFVFATFAFFLVKEKAARSRLQQLCTGANLAIMWVTNFVCDFFLYLVVSAAIWIVYALFNVKPYITEGFVYVVLVFVLFGVEMILLTYILARLFTVPSSAFNYISTLFIILGLIEIAFFQGLLRYGILNWILHIFSPQICFVESMRGIHNNYNSLHVCDNIQHEEKGICLILDAINETHPCCKETCSWCASPGSEDYLAWDISGIGKSVFFLFVQVVLCLVGLVLLEHPGWKNRSRISAVATQAYMAAARRRAVPMQATGYSSVSEDPDVAYEKQRLTGRSIEELCQTEAVFIRELKKYYGNFLAVDDLSLGIQPGECFGLLGANGAGKTTIFQVMTGGKRSSAGQMFINGYSVLSQLSEVRKCIGYCPQLDALLHYMTVHETLVMYARIRGVKQACLEAKVAALLKAVLLQDHVHKRVGDLSGGSKRKLSTAIALIGDPKVILLDEPTNGLDPVARRRVWALLGQLRNNGRTIVLTSHSMEECEALCTRLAIMVNGHIKCIGSTQHLKAKFGDGYSIVAKITVPPGENRETKVQAYLAYMAQYFPAAILQSSHEGNIHYRVPYQSASLVILFGTMERCKTEFCIVEYNVSQATLEQVFLHLTSSQKEPSCVELSTYEKLKKKICGCRRCNQSRAYDENYDYDYI